MMEKNKNEKYTMYADYLKSFLIQKVCIHGIFFIFIFFHHYRIIYLYFSVFQLVSTNCFSIFVSRLGARRLFDTVIKQIYFFAQKKVIYLKYISL